ncbi:MAG TPA: response regulator transcription factor [Gammaproteobacteria bacterium]
MDNASVVLVDMTQYGPDLELARIIESRFPLLRISRQDDIEATFAAHRPLIACFEYDFPDMSSLSLLTEVKRQYSSVPVIMFTEQHSEALAVWALRARVWNYFVKPVTPESVMPSLSMLARLLVDAGAHASCDSAFPPQPLPQDVRFKKHRGEEKLVELATSYIEQHLHEKLLQSDIASRCGTTSFQLSRIFKRVYGITFQEFIIRRRLEKASELLCNDSASIVDVCWTVGFRDASHFTKMFHRYSGLTPSQYRHKWRAGRKENLLSLSLTARDGAQ